MDEEKYPRYHKAYLKAVDSLINFYNQCQLSDEKVIRDTLTGKYHRAGLDPDGKAVRYVQGIKCTADGLLSIRRICNMEKNVDQIVPVYERYRVVPMFFFPGEVGGINITRGKRFGDRIDHTLYDLKMNYSTERDKCFLKNAYNRPKTNAWLSEMGTFEQLIDWFGVKGIFTDESYNVYDLEFTDNRKINSYRTKQEYQKSWSETYYNNLKSKIDMYFENVKRIRNYQLLIPDSLALKYHLN